MVRILTEPKDSLVKQFQASFAMDGVELEFEEEALLEIGRTAIKRPTGARARPYRARCRHNGRSDRSRCLPVREQPWRFHMWDNSFADSGLIHHGGLYV